VNNKLTAGFQSQSIFPGVFNQKFPNYSANINKKKIASKAISAIKSVSVIIFEAAIFCAKL